MSPRSPHLATMAAHPTTPTHSTLLDSNSFFESAIDFFPASIYITTSSKVDNAYDLKYKKGGNKESKDVGRIKNKLNSKLNKAKKYSEEGLSFGTVGKKRQREHEENEAEAEASSDEFNSSSSKTPTNPPPSIPAAAAAAAAADPTLGKMELLRIKLQNKIAAQKSARGITPDEATLGANTTGASKRAARRKRKDDLKKHHAKKGKGKGENSKKEKNCLGHSNVAGGADTDTDAANVVAEHVEAAATATATKKVAVSVKDDLNGIDFGELSGLVKKKVGLTFQHISIHFNPFQYITFIHSYIHIFINS